MCRRFLFVLALAVVLSVAAPSAAKDAPALEITVDPRVELMSVIFRLAGSPEYCKGRVASYVADVEAHFGKHRDHAVVETARRLRAGRGVSYDAVMSLAIHLKDAKTLREAVPLKPRPGTLDDRWRVAEARLFLDQARRFAKETGFDAFFAAHKDIYATTVERAQAVLAKEARLDWFGAFFGARPGASFRLVLGMLNGPSCYGPRVRKGKTEELYCILGVWATDAEGLPVFDRNMVSTVAHEFCHSWANPLVDANEAGLRKAGETLYPLVEQGMRRQAYANWLTMFRESLVRACVVRYVRATQGAEAARAEANAQVARDFHWVPDLAALLGEYEADRERYGKLDAFMPRVVAFFDDLAPEFAADWKKREAARPHVVSMTPAPGATDVDPGLKAIVVTFDRPMVPGNYAVVGGGPHFPETTGRPTYDGTRRVLTIPVKLKPDWSYEFWLNRGRFNSFRSAGGVPLASVHVTFRTRKR
jgi:hypothetical protein